MLVGRDVLLAAGDMALAGAEAGHGRLLLLTGEAGIGKTTLAHAIADRAAARGALVRSGACWESERLPPFTPWLDALHRPGADACAAAAAGLEGSTGHAAADAADALRSRGRRFADVIDALRACGADRAQVVVLEDLHWADRESLELLVAVAAHLPTMSVLLIATYRDDELRDPGELASVGGNADRLALAGLDGDATAAVLESVLGRPVGGDELATVQRQTGGNPLFVTQVARLLGSGSTALPSGLRDVLARRLARTSSDCDRVLGAASALGVEFDEGHLEAMTGASVAAELDEAAAARLVARIDEQPRRWRFIHALVQTARYELLSVDERARLHRSAVDVLQRGPSPASPATLAHHAARAGFAPDDPLPSTLMVAAGHEALLRLAWADAIDAFERGLRAAPDGATGMAPRAEAWLGIGAARLRQGRDDAREAFDAAASLGRQAARPDVVARAALGFSVGLGAFEVRLLDHHQIDLLEEAAGALAPDDALLPLVLARLSVALSFVGSSDRRVDLAERAVELARAAGDPVVLGHALAAWCDARADPAHIDQRLQAASEAVTLAQRGGDLPLELLGRRLRLVALLERCDNTAAELEVASYERSAAALGDPLYTWYGALWRATFASADGRFAEALELLNEALGLGALGGSTNSRLLVAVNGVTTAVDRRDRAAADRAMAGMLAVVPAVITPYADVTNAYIDAALGDIDRARARLATVSPERLDELPRDSEWICAIVQAAYAAARTGVTELVKHTRMLLEPVADCAAVEGIGAYVHGSVHRFLALLAGAEGEWEAARQHVAASRAAVAGGGIVLEALADLDGARALAGSPDDADQALATELAASAASAFRQVGMEVPAEEADGMAAAPSQQAVVASRSSAVASAGQLSRVGDSWAFTWAGQTIHVRHAKGVADLAVILERAGREVHVRELEGAAAAGASSSRQPALDETAVQQYRQRLVDLEEDLDEADRHGDAARAARISAERDALVEQLTAAFGLGGRARSAGGDPDERLRKAVSARVRSSIDKIATLHPSLGRHLNAAVRTGFWCSYQPEHPTSWSIERQ
ncbi:MAG: ATP-binding protein [Actinomycetota bacterium]